METLKKGWKKKKFYMNFNPNDGFGIEFTG